jgi:hypothetical protein
MRLKMASMQGCRLDNPDESSIVKVRKKRKFREKGSKQLALPKFCMFFVRAVKIPTLSKWSKKHGNFLVQLQLILEFFFVVSSYSQS